MKTLKVHLTFLIVISFLGCQKEAQVLSQSGKLSLRSDQIISDIGKGKHGETHSFIIYQNNKLIAEHYFEPFDIETPHYQYSVTKSITSILIGIAIDKGYIKNVDQKVLDFFPEYTNLQFLDEKKQAITVADLLAMKAGFKWDEWTYSYLNERNDANQLIRSNDMMKFMLDLPMAHHPGTRFTYNSGATMLLSGIILKTTGKSTEAFAKEYLFHPLGIKKWDWEKGANEISNTGWGLHLLPKDMASIGRLVLNKGLWEGQRIISESWLEQSVINRSNNYGYQWWLSGKDDSFSARGWGGQFIFVVPKHQLVLVTTAGNFNNGHNSEGLKILEKILESF